MHVKSLSKSASMSSMVAKPSSLAEPSETKKKDSPIKDNHKYSLAVERPIEQAALI